MSRGKRLVLLVLLALAIVVLTIANRRAFVQADAVVTLSDPWGRVTNDVKLRYTTIGPVLCVVGVSQATSEFKMWCR